MVGRPSAVEKSPFRKEIEEMIKEGKPDQFISDWLKDHKAPISRQTINNYKNTKFNVPLKARKKYNERQSKKRLNQAVDEQVNDIEKIDSLVAEVDPGVMKDMLPKDQVRSVAQLLNTKYKILGVIDDGKPVNVKVAVHNEIPEDPKVRARGRDFIQSIRAGQVESGNTGHGDKQ